MSAFILSRRLRSSFTQPRRPASSHLPFRCFSLCLRWRPHSRCGFVTRALSWLSPFPAPARPRHWVFRAQRKSPLPLETTPGILPLTVMLCVCPNDIRCHTSSPDPRPAASGSLKAGSVSIHLDNLVPSLTFLALHGCSVLNKYE